MTHIYGVLLHLTATHYIFIIFILFIIIYYYLLLFIIIYILLTFHPQTHLDASSL